MGGFHTWFCGSRTLGFREFSAWIVNSNTLVLRVSTNVYKISRMVGPMNSVRLIEPFQFRRDLLCKTVIVFDICYCTIFDYVSCMYV